MNRYFIHESNLEKLEKKLNTIKNKCNKIGTEFHYQLTGNVEYREVESEEGYKCTLKFIEVEAEGKVYHGPWEFVAVLEHKEAGNVIRNYNKELEPPERYRTCGPMCEHCNKIRSRKDTFIIYNSETQEFKQVGRSCLNEYTNGLDAEEITRYISLYGSLAKGESFESVYSNSVSCCYEIKDVVAYAFETVRHFGYISNYNCYGDEKSTKARVFDYMMVGNTRYSTKYEIQKIKDEMKILGFDASSMKQKAEDAIKWVNEQEGTNNYINNLKVICAEQYCSYRDLGIIISLAAAYNRAINDEIEKERREAEKEIEKKSDYLGQVGDKVNFKTSSLSCVWSGENIYGMSYMWKLVDEEDNVAMWTTNNGSFDIEKTYQVSGSIKKLEEYNEVKQTWLTRCKLTEAD